VSFVLLGGLTNGDGRAPPLDGVVSWPGAARPVPLAAHPSQLVLADLDGGRDSDDSVRGWAPLRRHGLMTDLTDLAIGTHAGSLDRLPNGGMQQTRSALTPIGAALAADPWCSTDVC
jgi:hypothetical protein